MKKTIFLGAAAAMLVAVPVLAQRMPASGQGAGRAMTRADMQSRTAAMFARSDADRNGFVTQAEAQAQRAKMGGQMRGGRRGGAGAEHRFEQLDRDGNGSISRAEFDAAHAGRAENRAERRENRQERRAERQAQRGQRGLALRPRAFERLDVNRDSRLSLAEAQAGAMARFARLDANRDGTLTREERRAARERMRAERQGRRAG